MQDAYSYSSVSSGNCRKVFRFLLCHRVFSPIGGAWKNFASRLCFKISVIYDGQTFCRACMGQLIAPDSTTVRAQVHCMPAWLSFWTDKIMPFCLFISYHNIVFSLQIIIGMSFLMRLRHKILLCLASGFHSPSVHRSMIYVATIQ